MLKCNYNYLGSLISGSYLFFKYFFMYFLIVDYAKMNVVNGFPLKVKAIHQDALETICQ